MRSNYSTLGFILVIALGALALWFVFGERFAPHPRSTGPTPYDIPPGTTPRQPDPPAPSGPPS